MFFSNHKAILQVFLQSKAKQNKTKYAATGLKTTGLGETGLDFNITFSCGGGAAWEEGRKASESRFPVGSKYGRFYMRNFVVFVQIQNHFPCVSRC